MVKEQKRKGRPPWKAEGDKFTERYTVLLTEEDKEYVLSHGGGAFIRELIEERRRNDADSQ
jgi:hypothetical protein